MVVVVALALTALVGLVDYFTGRDLALSALYLVPISWAAWTSGRGVGVMLAIVGAATWFIADSMSGYRYAQPLLPYWNSLMLLALFLAVVYSLTAFRTAHRFLEQTVQQRTAAVQALEAEIKERKRLEAAKLQGERLAVVGRMAAQLAHEVRNPLGSITLNLDLTRKEIDRLAEGRRHAPDEGRGLIKDMREEVCRIGHVIEDYLQFARLPKLQRQPLALNAFLDQKLAFINTELERGKVRLSTHFDPAPVRINADADQLWQAMLNLIRNSREAMPCGGELTIDTRCECGQVVLLVSDTGIGMSEGQRQQVFAPFFTTKERGTGLGMALVHQIVTEHGGCIECQSALGKGSTFAISLPLVKEP
ncbi:MAG: sensor histidine kinase [Limisphaerales bacterium]